MKVGFHQVSVLSPLLFAAVMDVVSSEARSGLPSELLYAADLVLRAPTMKQLGRRVAILLDIGLKVNAGKSKVMVGSSGGKMIVNSGKWPCGVCRKGVQANSVYCTVCKKMDSQVVRVVTTLADVPVVISCHPALVYRIPLLQQMFHQPELVLQHFYIEFHYAKRCSISPNWSSSTFIADAITSADVQAVLNGPPGLL